MHRKWFQKIYIFVLVSVILLLKILLLSIPKLFLIYIRKLFLSGCHSLRLYQFLILSLISFVYRSFEHCLKYSKLPPLSDKDETDFVTKLNSKQRFEALALEISKSLDIAQHCPNPISLSTKFNLFYNQKFLVKLKLIFFLVFK